MARIKYVMNERRLAYEGAVERFSQDKALGKWGATAEQEAMLAEKGPTAKKKAARKGSEKGNGRTMGRRRPRARATSTTEIPPSPSEDMVPLPNSPAAL